MKDPEKRRVYDQYGEDGLNGGMGGSSANFSGFNGFNFSSFDPHETFKQFFGDKDPFSGIISFFISLFFDHMFNLQILSSLLFVPQWLK